MDTAGRCYAPLDDILVHLRWIAERALESKDAAHTTLANNVAYYLVQIGDYPAARPLYERALAIYEQALGPIHPHTATSMNNLAGLFSSVGDYAVARPLYERALAIREQALGPSHPDTARSLNNLALLLSSVGDYAAAQPLYELALTIREQALGPRHPDTATSLYSLAVNYAYQEQFEIAADLMRRALAIYEERLGADHPNMKSAQESFAAIEQRLAKNGGQSAKASQILQNLGTFEERLAGSEGLDSIEAVIAEITRRAESAVAQAFADGTANECDRLAERLEDVAWEAEHGGDAGSPGKFLLTTCGFSRSGCGRRRVRRLCGAARRDLDLTHNLDLAAIEDRQAVRDRLLMPPEMSLG